MLKVVESPGKIVVTSWEFLIDRITESGNLEDIKDAILETGLTLELRGENASFGTNPIIITPEQVAKDRAWMQLSDMEKDRIWREKHAI
jgi:hypothetical protein